MDKQPTRSSMIVGAILVTIGVLIFLGQVLNILNWAISWPLIIVGVGGLFFVGMLLGGKNTAGLAIPGSIIMTIGLIFLVQNALNRWETWAYAWALIITAIGVGIAITGRMSQNEEMVQSGWRLAGTGLVLFLVFGAIIELVFSLAGVTTMQSSLVFPILLVVLGLFLFVQRVVRLLRTPERATGDTRDLFWPIFFVGMGLLWGLVILGWLTTSQVAALLSLWPALLILVGVNLIIGRRFPWVGALLGVLVVAGMFFLSFNAERFNLSTRLPWDFGGIVVIGDEPVREQVTGSGTIASESRSVSDFNRIEFTAIGEAEIVQGTRESLVIEAEDNLLPYITSEVSNGRLLIGVKPGVRISPTETIRYQITVVDLSQVIASGASRVLIDALSTPELNINSSGAGVFNLQDFMGDRLEIMISGSGNVTASGEVQELEVQISGAGSLDGAELRTEQAQVSISGFGSPTLWVTEELDVRISGAGSVSYYGDPQISQDISGLGSLNQLGEK